MPANALCNFRLYNPEIQGDTYSPRASGRGAEQPVLSGRRRGTLGGTGRPRPQDSAVPARSDTPGEDGGVQSGTSRQSPARLSVPSPRRRRAPPVTALRQGGRALVAPREALPYLLPKVDGDVGDAERDQKPDQGPVVSERWKFHHSPSCAVTPSASAAAGDGAGGRRGGRLKGQRRRVRACPCACVRAGECVGDKGEGEKRQSPLKIKQPGERTGGRSFPARRGSALAGAGWAAGRAVLPP